MAEFRIQVTDEGAFNVIIGEILSKIDNCVAKCENVEYAEKQKFLLNVHKTFRELLSQNSRFVGIPAGKTDASASSSSHGNSNQRPDLERQFNDVLFPHLCSSLTEVVKLRTECPKKYKVLLAAKYEAELEQILQRADSPAPPKGPNESWRSSSIDEQLATITTEILTDLSLSDQKTVAVIEKAKRLQELHGI